MTTVTATVSPDTEDCTRAQHVTKSLLGYGVLAGVVFEAAVLIQGLTRYGFSIALEGSTASALHTAAVRH
jgi:hypothetical protein